jgi:hypothetical protein
LFEVEGLAGLPVVDGDAGVQDGALLSLGRRLLKPVRELAEVTDVQSMDG